MTLKALMARCFGLLLVASLLAGPAWARSASKPSGCAAVPRGWRVATRDAQAVIIKGVVPVADPDGSATVDHEPTWKYCLRDRGRFQLLVQNSAEPGSMADIITVSAVQLVGEFATWVTDDSLGGGRYGEVDGTVYLRSLTTGKIINSTAGCCTNPPSVLLSSTGIALWQTADQSLPPYPYGRPIQTWHIESLSANTGKWSVLQSALAPTYGTSPFTDLRLERCLAACSTTATADAWWQLAGAWQTATLD